MLPPSAAVCVLGFGETGLVLATELAARGCAVRGYDRLLDDTARRAPMQQLIEEAGVHPATLAEAVGAAKLVICTAAAHEARDLVRTTATLLQRGQIFLDLSDVPPAAKRANATVIEESGADYVDASLPSELPALHLAAPMLLGGARAAELAPALNALGFDARAVGQMAGFDRECGAPGTAPARTERSRRTQPRRGELP